MRVGFIGLGFASSSLHLPALRAIRRCEFVGGVDPDAARRMAWVTLQAGPAFETLEELLAEGRPELVVVAAPPHLHAEACRAALEAGAHVMCEKPFVEDLDQADDVLSLARSRGRQVVVNHEFRFMPIFSCLPAAIGQQAVGRPVFLHCTQFMDLPPWEEQVPWRAAMEARSLFEGGIHIVDLFHMIAGRLPERVYAATSSGLDTGRLADAIHLVTLDYGGGLLGQITVERLCRAGTRYVDLQVDCEHASLRASYGGRAFVRIGAKRAERTGVQFDFGFEGLAWLERGRRRRVIARNPRKAAMRATRALYEETFAAIDQNTEPPTPARTARETLRIVEAAYRSARTGQPVLLETASTGLSPSG